MNNDTNVVDEFLRRLMEKQKEDAKEGFDALYEVMNGLMDAGFSRKEAFEILLLTIEKGME